VPRPVLVYRDRILARSEHGFMRRQYLGFSRLAPFWVGTRRDPDGTAGLDPLILGGGGMLAPLRRALFKQAGVMPPDLRALAARRPALIHAQFGRGGAIALPLARALRVPLVVTFHGGDAHKDVHYRPGALFARRLPGLLAYAARFVCVSPSVAERLVGRGVPPEKLTVLPIGVEPAAALPPPAGGHILFIGRMVEKKGVPVLLDALARLRAAGDTTPAVLVGDGPLLAALRPRAEALGGVTLPGWQSQDQLRGWFAGARCLAVPSVTGAGGDAEGLPSVAAEAMMLGVPLVASTEAGVAHLFGPSPPGALVPARDAAALAAALAALADPAARAAAAAAAHALARRELDATVQSARLEALLLSVLA
jgi:colanic acid/amylovoran biosynthesis glycosyltransferase